MGVAERGEEPTGLSFFQAPRGPHPGSFRRVVHFCYRLPLVLRDAQLRCLQGFPGDRGRVVRGVFGHLPVRAMRPRVWSKHRSLRTSHQRHHDRWMFLHEPGFATPYRTRRTAFRGCVREAITTDDNTTDEETTAEQASCLESVLMGLGGSATHAIHSEICVAFVRV